MCSSHAGGNVFAHSGRKREEMGSDKFRFLAVDIRQSRGRRREKAAGASTLADRQLSCTLSPGGAAWVPHGAGREGGHRSSHLQGQLGGEP